MGFRTSKFMTGMKSKKAFKTLSVAALAGVASLGATNSTMAQDTPITPTLGENASYTLKEVSAPIDNSITLYKYDNTGITEAVNYEVNLKTTEYGEGDTSKYYNWVQDANGNYTLVESTTGTGDIEFKYDSTNPKSTIINTTENSVTTIDGTFISNYTSDAGAGVKQLSSTNIERITADFIDNYVYHPFIDYDGYPVNGTAIFVENDTSISLINGNFVGNNNKSYQSYGGAIYNRGTIGDVNGSFIANNVNTDIGYTYGGAIYNKGTMGNITGDFIGNYAHRYTQYNNDVRGGAIFNSGNLGDITGNFVGNYAKNDVATANGAYGGAIYNIATIGNITGDFIANYVSSAKKTEGSAIYNTGTIGNITGDFIGNYSTGGASTSASVIYNSGTIGDITANFIGNTGNYLIYNDDYYSHPGALGGIKGNFIGNHTVRGLIKSDGDASISGIIDVNFIDNIVDDGDIFSISPYYTSMNEFPSFTANFINNTVLSKDSYLGNGTILVLGGKASIDTMNLQFIGNKSYNSIFSMGAPVIISPSKCSPLSSLNPR